MIFSSDYFFCLNICVHLCYSSFDTNRIMYNKLIIAAIFTTLIVLSFTNISSESFANQRKKWSKSDIEKLHTILPPYDSANYFPTSSQCMGCHGHDPNMNALVDLSGNDVNPFDFWSASMMANSAKDPFWRAKVSHEITVNPTHANELQDKCTSCHGPMGHFQAFYKGAEHYSIADLDADTFGLDGVSCGVCHKISPQNLGTTFSGDIKFDTSRVIYGPFLAPYDAPMNLYVGFQPIMSQHIKDSDICASCHTLVTSSVDNDGQLNGNSFVEQATYHEWLNSIYNTTNISCQHCHMPSLEEPIVISNNYLFLQGRSPFSKHELTGANSYMLKLMKIYKQQLGINASDANFDRTIALTLNQLKHNTLNIDLQLFDLGEDSLNFDLKLENKGGHKFPSGYPSRRAFVEFIVKSDITGDTIFHSGKFNEKYEIIAESMTESMPHFDVINKENEVQIYEMVMGDVNHQFTTVLERANFQLKDNRIPPKGFKTDHYAYDTVKIVGNAIFDTDFNKNIGSEGTGMDHLKYHIFKYGTDRISVYAKVHYQSLPPKWLYPMFAYNTDPINTFKAMYESMPAETIVIAEDSIIGIDINPVGIVEQKTNEFSIFPNPVVSGQSFSINSSEKIENIILFDVAGKVLLNENKLRDRYYVTSPGVYFAVISRNNKKYTKKILVL